MSYDTDQWSDDPRLTAFALGELEPAEADAIAEAVQADPELRRLVEEVQDDAALFEAALHGEPAPLLLPAQRETILGAVTTADVDEPLPSVVPRRRGWVAATVGMAAALSLWWATSESRQPAQQAREPQRYAQFLLTPTEQGQKKATGRPAQTDVQPGFRGVERYAPIESRGMTKTSAAPQTTFSVDVDTASYSNVRRFLQQGALPPADAVRVEELVNYFDYDLPPPDDGRPVAIHVDVTDAPWASGHLVARVALKGEVVQRAARPAAHLVFLLDVSGSMEGPERLPLVKRSLGMLLEQLEPHDTIAIVTYAGGAGVHLRPTPVSEVWKIQEAIAALEAGGSTAGAGGIRVAYQVARETFEPDAINRVILATDGDFNVGISEPAELEQLIADEAKSGVFLTVLGFGMGNLNDITLETLADKGNGHYAYIDRLDEAKKVLVDELSSTIVTIAKDVKVQLEFNPDRVQSYQLVGYENRRLEDRDFADDQKDAGDMGAGHAVTMLYELVPTQGSARSDGRLLSPQGSSASDELFRVRVRYKEPDADRSALVERVVRDAVGHFQGGAEDLRWATTVAAFALKLRGAAETQGLRYQTLAEWADGARRRDPQGRRAELVDLIRAAAVLSGEAVGPTP